MADRNPQLRDYVLLVRRATMGLDMALVKDLSNLPWSDAVQRVVEAPLNGAAAPRTPNTDDMVTWWTRLITTPGGLQERMAFFWHCLLTTNRWAVAKPQYVPIQLDLIRANALGNFRTLLRGFVIDGALIRFLNADGNTVKDPNENLARELMELFTTGIGHYSEDDVRAAAKAMTGWQLDEDNIAVRFNPDKANAEPVTFMGEAKRWDVPSIVDRLCDHPATAARISARLWYHLAGTELSAARAKELGAWWQAQNLEIKPLVSRIFDDPEMLARHYARPRSGYEFYTALNTVSRVDPTQTWQPRSLGQALYEPPNVAGWPDGDRWLTPDSMLRRSSQIFNIDLTKIEGAMTAGVDEILDRCGLYVLSQATLDAVNNAGAGKSFDEASATQLRWRVAMSSPEFQLT